jgi:hypothetical protein
MKIVYKIMKQVSMDRDLTSFQMLLESYFYNLQKLKYAQNTLYKSFKIDKNFVLQQIKLMIQKNRTHFYLSNGILFAKFRVTKLNIRILQYSREYSADISVHWSRLNRGQRRIWAIRTIGRTKTDLEKYLTY